MKGVAVTLALVCVLVGLAEGLRLPFLPSWLMPDEASNPAEPGNAAQLDLQALPQCPLPTECDLSTLYYKLSYPLDCTKYIYCSDVGSPVVRRCALDLHFSPTEFKCMLPSLANCPECLEFTTQPPETTTPIPICLPTPTCEEGNFGGLKPYPLNCTKYIYCNGSAGPGSVRTCSNARHFSVETASCMSPELANCVNCVPASD